MKQHPLDPTLYRDRSMPSGGVLLFEEAKRKYQDLINIMQKVWARFIKRHVGITSILCDLEFKLDFPVRIHIAHLLSFL